MYAYFKIEMRSLLLYDSQRKRVTKHVAHALSLFFNIIHLHQRPNVAFMSDVVSPPG